MLDNAEREDIHQRIAVVAFLENGLAADGRDAEAIAVMRDAGDDAFEDTSIARARLGIVERSESERVQHRDRPRSHREDVAQNSADAGGGALETVR